MSPRGGWVRSDTEPLRLELLSVTDARHWRAVTYAGLRRADPVKARATWRLAKQAGAYPVETTHEVR